LDNLIKDMYERDYGNMLHLVNGVYIPFDIKWKNIGVSVSGGADSAMLAYVLCKLITENDANTTVHIISHIRMWERRPWQRKNSLDVYDWLVGHFTNITFKRHENFISPDLEWGSQGATLIDEYGNINSGDIIEIQSFAKYIAHRENLDIYYNAVSHNPSTLEIDNRFLRRDIVFDDSEKTRNLIIRKHGDRYSCHPFRFEEKKWIISCYKLFDALDLLDVTRSCEGDNIDYPDVFKGLDYKSYKDDMRVPTCGKCFWCRERDWALTCD